MFRMLTGKPLRHEDVHEFSHELVASIAKQLFDLRVHQHNPAFAVHQHDPAWGCLHCQPEFFLRLLAFSDVHQNAALPGRFAVLVELDAAAPGDPANSAV